MEEQSGAPGLVVCPICNRDSDIQKVSGLYREQRTSLQTSDLARLLAPPTTHAYPRATAGGGDDPIGWFAGFLLAGIIAVAFFANTGDLGWIFGILAFAFGGVVFGIIGTMIGGSLAEASAARANDTERQSPAFLARTEAWEQDYYCRTDDVVFLPSSGELHSPSRFSSFLNER